MGNIESHLECDERNYNFVGREQDIERLCKHIDGTKKLVVQISGMQEVGKSRVLTQIVREYHTKRKCVYFDLSLEDSRFNSTDAAKYLTDLQQILGLAINVTELKNVTIQDVTKAMIKKVKSLDEYVVLFLDNVDMVFESDGFKDNLLEFLKDVCENSISRFKVVFTSAVRIQLTSNAFVDHEIKVLSDKDIQKLFHQVIKEKAYESDNESDEDDDGIIGDNLDQEEDGLETYEHGDDDSLFKEIMSPSNMIFIDALIKLCSGLPTLATMMGTELAANDGLIGPKDMVVLIIEDILSTLSPDCYPKSDRAENFREAIKKLEKRRNLLDKMNRYLNEENSAGVGTVVTVVENARSEAEAKQKTRVLLDHNVVMYSRKGKQFKIPAIFRECLVAMKPLEKDKENQADISKEDQRIRDLLKLGRLKLAEIPGLPENVMNSPKELEEFLQSLEDSPEQKMNHLISQPSLDDDNDTGILSTSLDRAGMGNLRVLTKGMDPDLTDRSKARQNEPVQLSVNDDWENLLEYNNFNRSWEENKKCQNGDKCIKPRVVSFSGPQAMSYRQVSNTEPNGPNVLNDLSMDNSYQENKRLDSPNNIDHETDGITSNGLGEQVEPQGQDTLQTDRSSSVEDNNLYDSLVDRGSQDSRNENNEKGVQLSRQDNVGVGLEIAGNNTDCSGHVGNLSQKQLLGTGVKMKINNSEYTSLPDIATSQTLYTDNVITDDRQHGNHQRGVIRKEMTVPHGDKFNECERSEKSLRPGGNLDGSLSLFDSD